MNSALIVCQSFLDVKFPEMDDRKSSTIILQDPRITLYCLILGKHPVSNISHTKPRVVPSTDNRVTKENVAGGICTPESPHDTCFRFKHSFDMASLSFRIMRKYWHGEG